ncbi:MAG: response regulator [Spartobacteria bacterium]|nr:response regulator [Spartobacteria bacterium]
MACILLIDDDRMFRQVLRNLLEDSGYAVMELPDGRQSIPTCRENKIDAVITDILMPDREGLETIMALRREFPELQIIAISGGGANGPDIYLKTAERLGVSCALSKPFKREELLQALEDICG